MLDQRLPKPSTGVIAQVGSVGVGTGVGGTAVGGGVVGVGGTVVDVGLAVGTAVGAAVGTIVGAGVAPPLRTHLTASNPSLRDAYASPVTSLK